ncbi:hypothetical protein FI667_g16801, partial [Globisporangium splendens]
MATVDTLRALEHEILHNEDLRSREVFLAALRSLQHEQQRAQTAENTLAQERQRASATEERASAADARGDRMETTLTEIRDELRQVHSYARRTHNTLTAVVDKSSQLFNALSHSHPKSIVNPREQKLQPGVAVLDVSACPKQRRIYGSE